jgi:hypothetical protein
MSMALAASWLIAGCADPPQVTADKPGVAPPPFVATSTAAAQVDPGEAQVGEAQVDAPDAKSAEAAASSTATAVARADDTPRATPPGPSPKTVSPPPATVAKALPPEPKPETKPTGPVVGKPWQVVASVAADPGYKCNEKYRHKFVTSGGTNVTYPTPKPFGSCAGKRAIAVNVPFVPTAAGPGTVSGTLRYGICDDAKTNCRIVKKPMTLAFKAAAE